MNGRRLSILGILIACVIALASAAKRADAADDVFEAALRLWDRGSFDSPLASARAHFEKHGREAGAADLRAYVLKASGMYGQAKNDRWTSGRPVPGETDNVRRFFRDDRYIDIYKAESGTRYIISFGRQ